MFVWLSCGYMGESVELRLFNVRFQVLQGLGYIISADIDFTCYIWSRKMGKVVFVYIRA